MINFANIKNLNIKFLELTTNLSKLNEEKKQLLIAEGLFQLPDDQVELLKIIILQNEKIIKLLENQNKSVTKLK